MFIFSSKGRYLTSKIKIWCQNLALWEGHFDHFWVIFWGFWKIFWSYSEVRVCALFFALKCPLLAVFSARKVLGQNLALGEGHYDHFQGQKSRFRGFLNVVLEMFRSCLGIIFGLKMPTFSFIFSSKGRYMTSKIKILCQNLALWEGHFDHFQGQKSRFLGFLKVVLEMFRSCLGIIFGLKMPTFSCIFSSKGRYMTSKPLLWGPAVALIQEKLTGFDFSPSK